MNMNNPAFYREINFDREIFASVLFKNNLSINKLAKNPNIHCSASRIKKYVEEGRMPEYIAISISEVLGIDRNKLFGLSIEDRIRMRYGDREGYIIDLMEEKYQTKDYFVMLHRGMTVLEANEYTQCRLRQLQLTERAKTEYVSE